MVMNWLAGWLTGASSKPELSNIELKNLPWAPDYDEKVRPCKVSHWTRPLNIYKSSFESLRHWAILFEWDDRMATYEANQEAKLLLPTWYEGRPKPDKADWEVKTLKEKNQCNLSPHEVNKAAKEHKLTALEYILGHRNCQDWAGGLVKDLDVDSDIGNTTISYQSSLSASSLTFGDAIKEIISEKREKLIPFATKLLMKSIVRTLNIDNENDKERGELFKKYQ